jgi:hypothetical protein
MNWASATAHTLYSQRDCDVTAAFNQNSDHGTAGIYHCPTSHESDRKTTGKERSSPNGLIARASDQSQSFKLAQDTAEKSIGKVIFIL